MKTRQTRLLEVLTTLQPIEDAFPEIEGPIEQGDINDALGDLLADES